MKKDNIIIETSYIESNNIGIDINNNVISTHYTNNRDNIIDTYKYLLPYISQNQIPRETIYGSNVTIKGTEANIKKIIANSTKDVVASVVETKDGYTVDFSNHHYEKVVCGKKDFYYSCVGIIAEWTEDEKEVKKTTFEYDGKELKYKNDDLKCTLSENEYFKNSYICVDND